MSENADVSGTDLQALVDATPDLIAEVDRDGRLLFVNEALANLLGRPCRDVVGLTAEEAGFAAAEQAEWGASLTGVFETGAESRMEFPAPEEGATRRFEARFTPLAIGDDGVESVLVVARDVTERHLRERRHEFLSQHDPLTELPNRRLLREKVEEALHRAERGRPSTLLFLDIDNFKIVNDEIGHEAGDELLIEFGALLRRTVRPTDLVARTGGDEFAVLLEDAGREPGERSARRVRREARDFEFSRDDLVFRPAVTIGAVVVDADAAAERTASGFLSRAEAAMRRGKAAGKDRVVFYRPEWGPPPVHADSARWMSRIRSALDEGRLEVYLQRLQYLEDVGLPDSFEAFVRLRENGDLVDSGAFVPQAERLGLVGRIDEWMVDAVLALLDDREGEEEVRIAVNLSGQSIGATGLLEHLKEAAGKRPQGLRGLMLEVTETTAVRNLSDALHWMTTLGDMGVPFALDDFGTGFASFTYLRTLPASAVKINGTFIEEMATDASRQAIVQSMVEVCHALEKHVVAEWVEDRETLDLLSSFHVDAVQGFYIDEPRPAAEVLS